VPGHPPDPQGPLARRLARIRRRLALWAALDGAVTGAAIAAGGTAVVVGLLRLRGHAAHPALIAALVGAGALIGAAAGGLRPISLTRCARLADRALDGEDRVLSAVWLAGSRSPLAAAAVADALARTERIDPRAVAPARPPAGLRALAGAAVVLAVVALMPGRTRAARLPPARSPAPAVALARLPAGALDVERSEAAAAIARADREGNPTARDLAAELDRVVRGLANGTLDESSALESLRALEQAAREAGAAAARDGRAADGAAGALAASPATRPAAEALRRPAGAEDAANQASDALASAAAAHPAESAGALRGASAAVTGAASQDSGAEEGQPGRRRLNRDSAAGDPAGSGGGAPGEDQARRLERLSRDLDQAAAACAAGDPSCRARAGASGRELGDLQRRAGGAPSLRELERESRQLHDRIARGDLRPPEGRAARAFSDAAAGKPSSAGKPGAGQAGVGQPGGGPAAPSGEPATAAAGASNDPAAAQGQGTGAGADMGEAAASGAGAAEASQATGSGIGHENGGSALGAARDDAPVGAGRQENVSAADGAGPSRAEVIVGAAGHGFASRSYTRVYTEYRAAVEDALGTGAVPPGQQYVVRRYFDLIRPRPPGGAGRAR
jgi:hypothetical protein